MSYSLIFKLAHHNVAHVLYLLDSYNYFSMFCALKVAQEPRYTKTYKTPKPYTG